MSRLHRVARAAAVYLAFVSMDASRVHAQLDPDDYVAIAPSWTPSAGTVTINTDALTISGVVGNGVAVTQPMGGPEIAAFTFGNIGVAAGVTINVTGSRALALLAQDGAANSFVMNGIINANGGASGFPSGGAAGPGGFRGGNGGAGTGAAATGSAGGGLGGGGGGGGNLGGGGGAGFGGGGGDSTPLNQNNGFGGLAHGDLLSVLHGGSGGGGGSSGDVGSAFNIGTGGGGGGGAVEIVSNGQLVYGGTINAIGGAGGQGSLSNHGAGSGGGSGGGVILAAQSFQQTGSMVLRGSGGGAGTYTVTISIVIGGGGGGGGGLAAFRLPQFTLNQTNGLALANVNLNGAGGGVMFSGVPPTPPQDRAGRPGQAGQGLVIADQLLIPAGESLTLSGTPEYTSPINANFKIRGNSYRVDGGGATLTLDQIVQSTSGIEVANGGASNVMASELSLGVSSISGDGSAGSAIHYAGATLVNGKLKGATPHTIDMNVVPTVLNSTLVNFGASVEQNGAAVFISVPNGGTIRNNAATLELVGGFNAGTMYVNSQINTSDDWFTSGSVHVANVAAWDHSGASLTNAGEIYLGAVASPGGMIDLNGATLQNSGSIANNGTINGDVINGANGIISGGGTINGSVINSSVVAPGNSPGVLAIGGDYTQSAAGELAIEVAASSYDHLMVTGNATLAGSLNVSLIEGFMPGGSQTFTILTADDVVGVFTNAILPDAPGFNFDVVYNPQSVVLTVSPAFTADFDEDGDVDSRDLSQWAGDFGANALSDADDDGDSDGADFLAWQRQLGSGGASAPVSAAVPEPSGEALALMAVCLALSTLRSRP